MTVWNCTYMEPTNPNVGSPFQVDDANPGTHEGKTYWVDEGPAAVTGRIWQTRTFGPAGTAPVRVPQVLNARKPGTFTGVPTQSTYGWGSTLISVDQTAPGEYENVELWCQIGSDSFGDPISTYVKMWGDLVVETEEPTDPGTVADTLAEKVSRFLTGRVDDPELLNACADAVAVVGAMARNYTRGNGFTDGEPDDVIEQVIIAASARLAANPDQLQSQVGNSVVRGQFDGWNRLERVVLGSYRKQAG